MFKLNKIKYIIILSAFVLILSSCSITEALNDFTNVNNIIEVKNSNDSDSRLEEIIESKEENSETSSDNSLSESQTENIIASTYGYELLNNYSEEYKELYGYKKLQEDVNYGSLLTDVYETFYESSKELLINDVDYEIYNDGDYSYFMIDAYEYTNSKLLSVITSGWMTMIEENPILYYLFTGYTVKTKNNKYYFCLLGSSDYAKYEDRLYYNEIILNGIYEFENEYEKLEDNSDYNKALFLHDYICNKIEYLYDSEGNASQEAYAHNILGVFGLYNGVCECYAKVYLFLSYRIDLNSLIVIGYSGNESNGHAWNVTELDGIWYGVDLTWDDDKKISYDYFLVSYRIMNQAHSVNSITFGINFQVPLPELSYNSYDISKDSSIPTPGSTGRGGYILIRW